MSTKDYCCESITEITDSITSADPDGDRDREYIDFVKNKILGAKILFAEGPKALYFITKGFKIKKN